MGLATIRNVTQYIYVLIDPRNGKAYGVGRTSNPKMRLKHHLTMRNTSEVKAEWIADLRAAGLKPDYEYSKTPV